MEQQKKERKKNLGFQLFFTLKLTETFSYDHVPPLFTLDENINILGKIWTMLIKIVIGQILCLFILFK